MRFTSVNKLNLINCSVLTSQTTYQCSIYANAARCKLVLIDFVAWWLYHLHDVSCILAAVAVTLLSLPTFFQKFQHRSLFSRPILKPSVVHYHIWHPLHPTRKIKIVKSISSCRSGAFLHCCPQSSEADVTADVWEWEGRWDVKNALQTVIKQAAQQTIETYNPKPSMWERIINNRGG